MKNLFISSSDMFPESILEIQQTLEELPDSNSKPFNILLLRGFTIDLIEPCLKFQLKKSGLNAKVTFGNYDNIFQDSLELNTKWESEKFDCILIFPLLLNFSEKFANGFSGLTPDEITRESESIQNTSLQIIHNLRENSKALILWHQFEEPVYPANGIYDMNQQQGQIQMIQSINRQISSLSGGMDNFYCVNTGACRTRTGTEKFYDLRYWHMNRSPYSFDGIKEITLEISKYLRWYTAKSKKCLVLDCDNILWGGILGEEGKDKIRIGQNYPGSAYYEFQQEVLNLYNRGIILALCSKNNEKDVIDVLENHPEMILKKNNFATWQINWEDKASNIVKIADDLNIGLDSMVFIDDSEYEIGLVKDMNPDVTSLRFPAESSIHFRTYLNQSGLFDSCSLSEEDKKRGEMYRSEIKRKKIRLEHNDLDAYYKSLDMEVDIDIANPANVSRVSQLCRKTNQFNLTTRRYSEEQISEFISNSDSEVLTLRVRDKIGDSGITGVSILIYKENTCIIDTLLLSCRILGRKIEDAFIKSIINGLVQKGYDSIHAEYIPTDKNSQLESFMDKMNFTEASEEKENGSKKYTVKSPEPLALPDVFKNVRCNL